MTIAERRAIAKIQGQAYDLWAKMRVLADSLEATKQVAVEDGGEEDARTHMLLAAVRVANEMADQAHEHAKSLDSALIEQPASEREAAHV